MKVLTKIVETKKVIICIDQKSNLYRWNKGTISQFFNPVSTCTKEEYVKNYANKNIMSRWDNVGGMGILQSLKDSRKKKIHVSQVKLVG